MSHPRENEKKYLVGVNYFGGWWREQPNKYTVLPEHDWRLDYPERIPILGCYNDQETMDAEIEAASAYGVDFFMMLWYVGEPERHENARFLNRCIEQFMKSPNSHKMRFMIEFCNHDPFGISDDFLWNSCVDIWLSVMKHPSYLKIGGKCLFKIHGLNHFYNQNEKSFKKTEERISFLRRRAREKGVGELLISAGVMSSGLNDTEQLLTETVDYVSTYMDVPEIAFRKRDYSYNLLISQAEKGRLVYAKYKGGKPYMPYVPAGWSPKPWFDPRPSFRFPSKDGFVKALKKVKRDLDKYPLLRVPDGKDGQKMFNIYAWNEFGEGGILAPTAGENYAKLEAIQTVFGSC